MDYNGIKYTWKQFKAYWEKKKVGGWLFDEDIMDLNLVEEENKKRVEDAWILVGKEFCK